MTADKYVSNWRMTSKQKNVSDWLVGELRGLCDTTATHRATCQPSTFNITHHASVHPETCIMKLYQATAAYQTFSAIGSFVFGILFYLCSVKVPS